MDPQNNTLNLPSSYTSLEVEDKIYKQWQDSGYFNPDKLPKRHKKPFTIIMPPPNANGSLHLGHAVFVTLQDIMIRYKRMQGFKSLWLPGTDHAGFETQVVFDKKLEKEGRNRFQIPREELYQEIWEFTQANKTTTEDQLRKLGASCDWSREKFPLDPDIIKIVYDTFEKLYKDGLAYRDIRVINWCPKHKTSFSDLEVKHIEREDPLYYIKYKVSVGAKENKLYLTVATVRPETMFGDTAIAVNPKDKRYKDLIGRTAIIPFIHRKIPIIADEAIDPDFGTGAVKVTPAHDPADFDIWQRHKDETQGPITVIDESGRLTGEVGEFHGLKSAEAREKIAQALKQLGILEKTDPDYKHQVSTCYKCGNVLEPLPKPQWWLKMKPLADKAMRAAQKGQIKFYPDRSKKVFFHWLKNIRDWNITRQIVWGIQVPVWYCGKSNNKKCQDRQGIIVSPDKISKCPYCGSEKIKQDPDVLDTWFSSSQWPFVTLMTAKKNDFKKFYPTDVMETGYDILFFWVARMIMLGLYRTGKVPFKNVYLHGLVRDKDRQKMSKSKGNVIDPLGVAEIYGTDAVRMALTVGNIPGNDVVISEDKIRGYKHFANKIWNASRFVLINAQDFNCKTKPNLTAKDKKKLKELKSFTNQITKLIESYKFYLAAEKLYHYFWHTFADKIIEESKTRLNGEDKKNRQAAQFLLLEHLRTLLAMLHPFMPFITEEIWSQLPAKDKKMLMIEKWPK